MDYRSDTSSPDPLGYPGDPEYILSSATKPFLRRQSTFSPRKSLSPTRRLSPSKADGRSAQSIRFQDIILPSTPSGRFSGKHRLSPTKTTTLNSENNTSPWRIRVTVEAEQDEADENFPGSVRSGMKSRRGRTTKVPLKDENDSLEPSPKKRRTGKSDLSQRVPTPRKIRSRIETPTGNTGTAEKRKRGRPRKSQPSVEGSNVVNKVTFAESVRKKMREEDPFLDIATEDSGTNNTAVDNILADTADPNPLPDFILSTSDHRSSPTPTERTMSQQPDSRSRVEGSAPDNPASFMSSPYSPGKPTGLTPENTIDAGHTPGPQVRGYPTPTSSSLLEEGIAEIQTGDSSGAKNQQSGSVLDPTTQHREFDSILESEGFSMVSLGTLPSARQQLNHSFQDAVNQGMINSMKKSPKKEVLGKSKSESRHGGLSVSSIPKKDDAYMPSSEPQQTSQLSQQVRRSPRRNNKTPGTIFPSSQQPRAPAIQPSRPPKKTRLVKLVRVIRAGIALQGVLNRRRRNSRLQSPFSSPGQTRGDDREAVRQRLDALFRGFGSETERELRAGLRFGEQLANRLQESESRKKREEPGPAVDSPMTPDGFAANERNDAGYAGIGNAESRSASSHSVKKHSNRELDGKSQLMSSLGNKNQSPQLRLGSEMARREAQWQREREIISRQIQQANSSQVIVIDSDEGSPERRPLGNEEPEEHHEDNPMEEEDYEDIWQQEAREVESQSESASFVELSREEIIKPPRRVLPSPWKRNVDVADHSQDEEATPGPGPYWANRTNLYPLLPRGKTETAKFREQNVESSSLLGSPESATRRFYQQNNVSPENASSQPEYPEDQRPMRSTTIPTFAASYGRNESPYSDDQVSDADAIHPQWAPSPESGKNETRQTSPDNGDVYSQPSVEDDHLYPELPSNSVHSSRNRPGAEEEIYSETESPNLTPLALQYYQHDKEPSTIQSQSPTEPQQEPRPSSWFHKLTDLAPSWLTTPASRKVERKQPESISNPASPSSPNREPSVESSSIQMSSPTQRYSVSGSPAQPLPIESSPIQQSPVGEPLAQDSPLQEPPARESLAEEPLVHQRPHQPIKRTMVDTGTQFSSPPITKPKRQIRRQPPSQRKALAISGYFTDDHYAALRHLYHKAKRSPGSFRYIETPDRNGMLGQRIYSADGVYSRRITEMQIAIVDKFRRALSVDSRRRGGTGKVEWSETELLRRLFSIIVGEQVRRERKMDLDHQLELAGRHG
ncbi:AT DNA binding protein [Blastomyces gilchristii SLH14081]|uniref:AT DNA binding protein n=1 Tax=Blastomyces gilchristii (strain SLH14081) TaxID=559298 RepID=A0A179UJ00_BLAGS|nr:AT DNA binding protein [Blastomyces gilchristii SLH14081]OAT07001.1 AT DNA binding protein [Blastomyces gilchristii SLH14081]